MSRDDEGLTEEALAQAEARYGWLERPIIRRRDEIDGPYSRVSRLELAAGGTSKTLYLKRLKISGTVDEGVKRRTRAEYDALNQFSARFEGHPHFGVARPLALFVDKAAILLEEVQGRSLMRLIGKSSRRYDFTAHPEVERYCAMSGGWLREFQSLTLQKEGAFDLERLVGYCDARFYDLIADGRAKLDEGFRARFEANLRKQYEENRDKLNVIVGCHHDFSPHNIRVIDDRVSVIDFGEFAYDSSLYDLCRFWFQLECMKSSPVFSSSRVAHLQAAFFSGYGESVDPDHPAFRLAASAYFLARLATIVSNGIRPGLRGWVDKRLFKHCLAWLAKQA